jgi:hypothetical protein
LARDAAALRAELPQDGAAPEQLAALGDPFLLPRSLPLRSEQALAAQLGADFAAAVMDLPVGRWSGPIASPFGLHFVWPRSRTPAELPPLAVIRAEVHGDWLEERQRRLLRDHLAFLRETAHIEIEGELRRTRERADDHPGPE